MTTTEITNPPKDCSNKAIIVTNWFSVEVSKAALLKEQGGSADLEIIGESCVMLPCLSYMLIDPSHDVKVSVSDIGVVSESEFIDLGPPPCVGTRDFDIGVLHWPDCTEKIGTLDISSCEDGINTFSSPVPRTSSKRMTAVIG